ncbi:hypothetical protein IWZ03DRAFT_357779 [Phyllosticta citriasiana]|uniref:Uncharacterized protein n=1 Tax=Phyllosticta citriasiana TaxID=595635 RepID=A0ABR1KVN8_9PEZI
MTWAAVAGVWAVEAWRGESCCTMCSSLLSTCPERIAGQLQGRGSGGYKWVCTGDTIVLGHGYDVVERQLIISNWRSRLLRGHGAKALGDTRAAFCQLSDKEEAEVAPADAHGYTYDLWPVVHQTVSAVAQSLVPRARLLTRSS